MKAEEFVNFVNRSIAPESGLRHIMVEDLHRWHEIGFFVHYPEYYRAGDFEIAIALLKHEADLRQRVSSPLAQPAQSYMARAPEVAFQRGIVQVVSCIGSSLIEEQLIIQGLKDINLIGSAGQIAVNFYAFSRKPVDIPSAGAEAKEGSLLIFEADDSGELEWAPVMTPLGKREFTADDRLIKTLWSLDLERKPELLSETEGKISSETAKRMNFPWPPEKSEALASTDNRSEKQYARSLFTFPVFVPTMAIRDAPATMVESVYITPNGQRIPPLPKHETPFPFRLYPAFLNTDGSSMQEIVNFMINYGLTLRFKFSTDDPQRVFCAEQQKMRQLLVEAHSGNIRFEDVQQLSPLREDALMEQDFIEALLLTPDYADYISEVRRVYATQEQKSKFVHVRRYYSWFDRMWAEVLEDIGQGLIPPLCKGGCGRLLSSALEHKRGRKREYCPDCERARGKERTRQWRLTK